MWVLVGVVLLPCAYAASRIITRRRLMQLRWPPQQGFYQFQDRVAAYLAAHSWKVQRGGLAGIDRLIITKAGSGLCLVKVFPAASGTRDRAIQDFAYAPAFGPGKRHIRLFVSAEPVPRHVAADGRVRNVHVIYYRSLAALAALSPASPEAVEALLTHIGDGYPAAAAPPPADAPIFPPAHADAAPAFARDARQAPSLDEPSLDEPSLDEPSLDEPRLGEPPLPGPAPAAPEPTPQPASAPSQEELVRNHVQAGRDHLKAGRLQDAKAAFAAALSLDPANIGALTAQGSVLNQLGEPDAAIATLRQAIQVAPKNPGPYVQLGWLLRNEKRWGEAEAAFNAALALDPKNIGAQSGLGVVFEMQGRMEEALACARSAVEMAPANASLLVKLGHLLLHKPATRDAAVAAFEAALAIDPKQTGALGGLASALNQQHKGQEAIAVLQKAIAIRPAEAGLHLRLGQLYEERHRLAEAASAFRTAVSLDPARPASQHAVRRVRNPDSVFALFARLIADPADASALAGLSQELNAPPAGLQALIAFARHPSHAGVAALATNPIDQAMLGTIATASHQRHLAAGAEAPPDTPRVAPPALDRLAEQGSHADWRPAQWLAAFLARQTPIRHRAAVVVTLRDEGLYLLEWIAHHRVLGFGRIVIYSNDNVDGSDGLLRALANLGLIIFIENRMDAAHSYSVQKKAYAHALNLVPELWEHEWVLFADGDEMLLPAEHYDFRIDALLDDLASHYPERLPSAVCFNWMWYVSGYRYAYAPGLLLSRFQHATGRRGMKSLVRLRDITTMDLVHFPEMHPDGFLVKSDFSRLERADRWKKAGTSFVSGALNHYWNKSFEEFSLKKARGDANAHRDSTQRRGFELFFTTNAAETAENHVPVPEVFIQRVQAEVDRLAALPGIQAEMDIIHAAFPELLARFDAAGGLRAIYDEARAATIDRGKPKPAALATEAAD